MNKENSIQQELLRPVNVSVSGNVISSDTGLAVEGVEVKIKRILGDNPSEYVKNDAGADLTAVTDASGNFSFPGFIKLDVDTYQHFLELKDPAYYTNDAMVIYSIRDAKLEYKDLRLISKNPKVTTIVRGIVKNVLSDAVVIGAKVKLTQGEIIFNAVSDANGTFAIESVPVSEFKLKLDASTVNFVIEESTIKLVGGELNDLGSLRIAPAIGADDLRLVLQWNESAKLDLDIYYTFPKETFNFNHLGVTQVKIPSADISLNPAFGFAKNTEYWPTSMGGKDENRYTMFKDAGLNFSGTGDNTFTLNTKVVMKLDRNSTTGSEPEVLTIYKENFMSSFPSDLSYYYDYVKNSQIKTYFPFGMGIFTVKCQSSEDDPNKSLYNSGAVVKVYQGNTYLGKFALSDLTIDSGESNRVYWSVLQMEMGYTKSNPTSSSDIYYRLVPVGSLDANPTSNNMSFYFNESQLPLSASFTCYFDLKSIQTDYSFISSSPLPVIRKLVADNDGTIYSYNDLGAYDTSFLWRKWTSMFFSPPVKHAFMWNLQSQFFNIAQTPTTGNFPIMTYRNYTDIESVITENPGIGLYQYDVSAQWRHDKFTTDPDGKNMIINDSAIVRYNGDQYFLVLATNEGPRGSKVGLMDLQLDTMISEWDENSTGVNGIELTRVVTARNQYGAATGFALIGGKGLYIFDCLYYDTNQVDFQKVIGTNSPFINLSDSSITILDIEQLPAVGDNREFVVATIESGNYKMYQVYMNNSAGAIGIKQLEYWDSGTPIRDLGYFYYNNTWNLLIATNKGIQTSTSKTYFGMAPYGGFVPIFPTILGTFDVTKIFEYNGNLGMFAKYNGLIYGPFPKPF